MSYKLINGVEFYTAEESKAADETLQSNIDTVASNLNSEIETREEADEELSERVTALETGTTVTSEVGSATNPVYVASGNITASNETVGDENTPVYLNAGNIEVTTGVATTSALESAVSTLEETDETLQTNISKVASENSELSDRITNIEEGKLGSINVGSATNPIYITEGVITASDETVGSKTQPVYLDTGVITASDETVGSETQPVYLNAGVITASDETVGDESTPVYLAAGEIKVTTDVATATALKSAVSALEETDETLQTNINKVANDLDVETLRASESEGGLSTLIEKEVGYRKSGDNELSDRITNIEEGKLGSINVGSATNPIYVTEGVITASDETVGSETQPVYLNAGVITASDETVGSETQPVYLNAGVITASDETVGSETQPVYLNAGAITASDETVGSKTQPVYLNAGVITASDETVGSETQPVYLNAGVITASDETVGSETQPVYLNAGVITASDETVGSETQPVYLNAGNIEVTTGVATTSALKEEAETRESKDSSLSESISLLNTTVSSTVLTVTTLKTQFEQNTKEIATNWEHQLLTFETYDDLPIINFDSDTRLRVLNNQVAYLTEDQVCYQATTDDDTEGATVTWTKYNLPEDNDDTLSIVGVTSEDTTALKYNSQVTVAGDTITGNLNGNALTATTLKDYNDAVVIPQPGQFRWLRFDFSEVNDSSIDSPDRKSLIIQKGVTVNLSKLGGTGYYVFDEDTSFDVSTDNFNSDDDYTLLNGADYNVIMTYDETNGIQLSVATPANTTEDDVVIGCFHTLCADVGTTYCKVRFPTGTFTNELSTTTKTIYYNDTAISVDVQQYDDIDGHSYLVQKYDEKKDADFYTFYNKSVVTDYGYPGQVIAGQTLTDSDSNTTTTTVGYQWAFVNHPLNGFEAGDILPESVWCTTWHPSSPRPTEDRPDAMVYCANTNTAIDVYMQTGTGESTRSEYKQSATRSRTPYLHTMDMADVGKKLLGDLEFGMAAIGSNENSPCSVAYNSGTTGGHSSTASYEPNTTARRCVSAIGCEDMCGWIWQWLDELGPVGYYNNGLTATTSGYTAACDYNAAFGENYGTPYVLEAGGNSAYSVLCGSWARNAYYLRSAAGANGSARGSSSMIKGIS